jgi:hypothetical protein
MPYYQTGQQFFDTGTEGLASVYMGQDDHTIYGGYDHSYHELETSLRAKHEIADEMIKRWTKFKSSLPPLPEPPFP